MNVNTREMNLSFNSFCEEEMGKETFYYLLARLFECEEGRSECLMPNICLSTGNVFKARLPNNI